MTDQKKMGRPPVKGETMSKAEYQRRYRAKKKAEQQQDAYLVMSQDDLQKFSALAEVYSTTRTEIMGCILAGSLKQLQGLEQTLEHISETRPEQVELYKRKALMLISEGVSLEHLHKDIVEELSGMNYEDVEALVSSSGEL